VISAPSYVPCQGGEGFLAGEAGVECKQAQALGHSGRAFDAFGVGEALTQHLVATADAEDSAAAAQMRLKVAVPALRAQVSKVSDGGFAAGENDERGVFGKRLPCPAPGQPCGGVARQRVQIVKIGDVRVGQYGDVYAVCFDGAGSKCQRIFLRELGERGVVRNKAERGPAGVAFESGGLGGAG